METDMLKFHLNKNDYEKVAKLLPELFPNVEICVESCDDILVALGLCESAPCIIVLNISQEKFEEILNELVDIETGAFNTVHGEYPKDDDLLYQKYSKYACLYDILNNAEKAE